MGTAVQGSGHWDITVGSVPLECARMRSRFTEIAVAQFGKAFLRYVADHREDHLVGIVGAADKTKQVVAREFHQRPLLS